MCKWLKTGATITTVSKEFDLGKSTVSDIKRNEVKLKTFAAQMDSKEGSRKRKTMKKANTKFDDALLYLWFSQKRSQGVPISGPLVMAKQLNEKMVSSGWLKIFEARHGIRQLAIQGETLVPAERVLLISSLL